MSDPFDPTLAEAEAAIAALVPDEHGFVEIAGWCLETYAAEYRRRGHLQVELDDVLVSNGKLNARIERMRADLARALLVVEAAGALEAHESKHWAIYGDDAAEQARLVLAVGAAVREEKGGEQ